MKIILIVLSLFFSTLTLASELPIKLSGTIEISVKNGTIDANFQLSNIPKLKNYVIHLNSGFNIQYFRNETNGFNYTYEKAYNTQYSEESFGYFFRNDITENKFLPDTIQFKYTGKFPVITDMNKASDRGDWKGNIAFNGKTIRTDGFQTAWYPILYDIEQDKRHDEVTYDIEVTCLDCKSIYVNGSKPISSTHGIFKREKPTSLTLFAGDYDIGKHENSYYLNSRLSMQQMSELGKMTSTFEKYYQDKLSIPYGESVVYIHTPPISKYDSWLFVAYPSIVLMNHNEGGLSNLIEKTESNWYKTFIAHELAHYYIGTYKKFNSELGDMFTESLAEYLALKLTKELLSEKSYFRNINGKFDSLNNLKLTGLKNIKTNSDYGDRERYIYTYAPVIWLAIEKEIGEEKMWLWLNKMLTVETEKTNYKFMIETLASVLNDDSKLTFLVKKYFENINAIDNAKLLLKETINNT
jgi:hypothetical protein